MKSNSGAEDENSKDNSSHAASEQADTDLEKLDFVKRMEIEVKRRQAREQANQLAISDKNCTFQPKINKKTEQLRARSIFEISVADHQRKENNRRALKLEAEQNDLVNMTFKPKISKLAKDLGKSVLQLSSDGSQFTQWLEESQKKKEKLREDTMKEREKSELANCTFKPQTTECPAYIKRIAKSMAVVKAARNSTSSVLDTEATKPQWR